MNMNDNNDNPSDMKHDPDDIKNNVSQIDFVKNLQKITNDLNQSGSSNNNDIN